MALPASGAISLFDVNDELGLSHSAQIGLLCTNVRTLFAVASGAVGMTTGYGKSNTSVPGAPTIGTATATGATTATVAFTAPGSNGGLTITSYTAVSSPGGITGTLSQAGSGTITVSGLSGATSYTFTVYATNSKGNSSSSSSSNSITTTPVIGASYGGGYFAGQISTSGNSVANYNLVIGPKASAQSSKAYSTSGVSYLSTISSLIDGPTNTTNMYNNYSSNYAAATFTKGLSVGGYSDWYLPAKNELEVCYYNLKPTVNSNQPYSSHGLSSGVNANAVPARSSPYPAAVQQPPPKTDPTYFNPSQTSASAFQWRGPGYTQGTEIFSPNNFYWSSSMYDYSTTWAQYMDRPDNGAGTAPSGGQYTLSMSYSFYVRAVRRVAV